MSDADPARAHPAGPDGPQEPPGSPRPEGSPPGADLDEQARIPMPRGAAEDSGRPLADGTDPVPGAPGSAHPEHEPTVPAQGARKPSSSPQGTHETTAPAPTPHEPAVPTVPVGTTVPVVPTVPAQGTRKTSPSPQEAHETTTPAPAAHEPVTAGHGTVRGMPRVLSHRVLKSLLGAWALAACSPEEAEAVELHLSDCGSCAEEALLLREAVGLLHPVESLDLDSGLRTRVLESSLARRAPRIPVPAWAAAYDAETARLDALLQDIGAPEWHAPVQLRWYGNEGPVSRRTTVAAVLGHLLTVDGLVAVALGLPDPLGAVTPSGLGPVQRTEAYWRAASAPPTSDVRVPWREQSHALVRTASFAAGSAPGGSAPLASDRRDPGGTGSGIADLPVRYGDFVLPLRDALVDRAFECWIHASDIATAVDYPYGWPVPRHMHAIVDLVARRLLAAPAAGRRPAAGPDAVSGTGRVVRLEIEGAAGGEWLIGLDSPGGTAGSGGFGGSGGSGQEVAHIALDDFEFCRLAAGHVSPQEATAGSTGDYRAITDVLTAVASLSRM